MSLERFNEQARASIALDEAKSSTATLDPEFAQPPAALSVQNKSPMEMIQVAFDAAIKQGSAMEVVNLILEQQRWMIQHNEEEAFNAALKRIQKQLKKIPKRGWNDQTKSNFALAQDVDDAIQHLLDGEDMTLSFRPAVSQRENEVLIVGTLSLGAFCREYPLPMPADGKGPQGGGVMSRTHATGSAITYGKRYLKDMIFDLRFQDPKYAPLEDDGNAAGATQPNGQAMPEGEIADWIAAIEGGNQEESIASYWKAMDATHVCSDPEHCKNQKCGDPSARAQFAKVKDKMKHKFAKEAKR